MRKSKPPLPIEKQIENIKSKGILIVDETKCREFLKRNNYQKLFLFREFFSSTPLKIENLINLYNLDIEIRNIIFYGLGVIETKLKTELAYYHVLKYGNHGYLKEDNNLSFLQDFRIFFQSIMLKEVQNYYVENFSEILNNFNNPEDKTNILEESAAKYLRKACKEISSKIFRSNEIVEAEILGYQVLNTLLEKFTNCILQKSCTDVRSYEGKICSLISENYKELNFCISPYSYLGLNKDETIDKEIMKDHIYNKIRCVIDFVSGMTDSFALEIYKKIMYR